MLNALKQVIAATTIALATSAATTAHGTDLSAGSVTHAWAPLVAALLIVICAVAGLAITFWSLRNDLHSRREAYRLRASRAGPPGAGRNDTPA